MIRYVRVASVAFAVVAAVVATQVPAAAQTVPRQDDPINEPRSVQVRYADLDLSRPKGVETLYRRIRFAADEVCGGRPNSVAELGAYREYQACYGPAVAQAVHRVDQPSLTALMEGRPERLAAR